MWLMAQTANEKLKLDVQTQDANGVQATSVLKMIKLNDISQQEYIYK